MSADNKYIAVIGGGPAGLAAALSAVKNGASRVLLIERDRELGGILNQCVHDGFGNFVFGESLTGPEYAWRFVEEVAARKEIEILSNTAVISLDSTRNITAVNRSGAFELKPDAVVLAMGCREKSRFQALIPGYRPAGIYSAGAAQRLINMEGVMPGEKAVILGSGDIGLIIARRLVLEGAEVSGVYELLNRPGGLTRNVVQCLDDFNIPLHLGYTTTFIHGKKRLEGVSVAPLGANGKALSEEEKFIPCDTLILSVGLIPENELSREAKIEFDPLTRGPLIDQHMSTRTAGIFACGNVVHVNDLVDYVTLSAETAGRGAAGFLAGKISGEYATFIPGDNVAYIVPQLLALPAKEKLDLYLRVKDTREHVRIGVFYNGKALYEKKERIVRPPEMIHLELEASCFRRVKNGERLTISIERKKPE